jgi:hypothetical protein
MRLEEIHISTVSPDNTEQQHPATGVLIASLEQRNRFRFCTFTFRLFDRGILSVHADGIFKHSCEYEFNICILNPEPKRHVSINWGYLSAFLILAMSAILTTRSNLFLDSSMASSLLSANAVVFLVLAAYSCRNRLVFYSRNGWMPLAIFLHRNPDDERFRAFIDALTAQIQEIQSRVGSRNEMLCQDLKEHRRLMECGIISEKHYDWIKQYILGLHTGGLRAQ